MMNKKELELKALALRRRFLDLFTALGFGHVTSAFSMTEILTALYYGFLRYRAGDPDWEERDRLVLSKGHGAGMLFPIWEDLGFFTREEMEEIIRLGGSFTRLRQYFYPGFEFYGGSLGMGLGMACGLALGARQSRRSWITVCLLGDAECYEGAVWEAALFAGHNRLNNLIALVDRNYLGCSDFTENMLALEPFSSKWMACGWDVLEVDGHSFDALLGALKGVRSRPSSRPRCIIAHTVKGQGLPFLTDQPLMHGYMPQGEDIQRAYRALGRSVEP